MHESIVSTTPLTEIKSFLVTVTALTWTTSPVEVDALVICRLEPLSVCKSCAGFKAVVRMSPNTRYSSRKASRKAEFAGFKSWASLAAGSFLNAESVGANTVVRSVPFSVLVQRVDSLHSELSVESAGYALMK
jgi:hypothetical protein